LAVKFPEFQFRRGTRRKAPTYVIYEPPKKKQKKHVRTDIPFIFKEANLSPSEMEEFVKEKYEAAVREGFLKLDVDLKGSMIPSVIIKFVLVCVDYAKLQQSQNDSHANIHQHKPLITHLFKFPVDQLFRLDNLATIDFVNVISGEELLMFGVNFVENPEIWDKIQFSHKTKFLWLRKCNMIADLSYLPVLKRAQLDCPMNIRFPPSLEQLEVAANGAEVLQRPDPSFLNFTYLPNLTQLSLSRLDVRFTRFPLSVVTLSVESCIICNDLSYMHKLKELNMRNAKSTPCPNAFKDFWHKMKFPVKLEVLNLHGTTFNGNLSYLTNLRKLSRPRQNWNQIVLPSSFQKANALIPRSPFWYASRRLQSCAMDR